MASLIPEDGTGIENADTYATAAEVSAYAAKRGLAFTAVEAEQERALVLACDYLQTLNWKGTPTNPTQALAWPRKGITGIADDQIPAALKNAQSQLAVESAAGTDLQPTGTGREVVREKVDVLEVQYADNGNLSVTPEFNKALDMLAPFLENGNGFSLLTARV